MTNADLIASLVAGFLLLIVGIVLLVKIRGSRPEEASVEEESQAIDSPSESGFDEDLVLSSLENFEFRAESSDESEATEIEAGTWEPASPEEQAPEEAGTGLESDAEVPTEPIQAPVATGPEKAIEEPASVPEEAPAADLPCPEPTEPVSPEIVGEFEPEEPVLEAAALEEETPLAGVGSDEETAEELIDAMEAEAEQIHAEIESLTENDADLRRATLRPAPSRKRRESQVSETLDSQITDLDHRLDALEALVASIEESLAEFEPLLEEEEGRPRAIAPGGEKAEAA